MIVRVAGLVSCLTIAIFLNYRYGIYPVREYIWFLIGAGVIDLFLSVVFVWIWHKRSKKFLVNF
jgi:hypothetical protein